MKKWLLFPMIMLLLVSSLAQAQVIGQWKDDSPAAGSELTLYKSGGSYYIRQVFQDGSKRDMKVKKTGNKYVQSGSQDYYIVDGSGNLKCFDRQGLIYEARSTSKPKPVDRDTTGGQSCYALGVKFGRCATLSMKGIACNPSDDIAIPPRCRGNSDTQRGIEVGTRSVF